MPDFAKLDAATMFNYKTDLYTLIKSFGYTYVSECLYDLYITQKVSTRIITVKLDRT